MTSELPYKIDLHSHFLPDFYQEALKANGHANPDGMPAVPQWTPEAHLALMDKLNISKSILSISSPGTHLIPSDDALAISLTRQVNQYAADLKSQHPTRFGYFASLPLPDIQSSLAEIPLALSEGADGFVLKTNHHGIYLGSPHYDPLFSLLNTHKAKVFIHPTTPKCPCPFLSSPTPIPATPLSPQFPNTMLEFLFDTSRIITTLYLSGTMSRNPDITFLLPHLGGAFPPLLSRWTNFASLVPPAPDSPPITAMTQQEVVEDMNRRVWFDLAGFAFPNQIRGSLATGVEKGRVVYGSDYPFTNAGGVERLVGEFERGVPEVFEEREEVEGVCWRNAERLLKGQ